MTRETITRIAIAIGEATWAPDTSATSLDKALAAALPWATIEIVRWQAGALPSADIVIVDAFELTSAIGSRELTLSSDDGRRIVLIDTGYNESMRLLDTYGLAASIIRTPRRNTLDGLREVGRRIGAREVVSASTMGKWRSTSYASLEHDECAASSALLGRYLAAYDPALPRLPPAQSDGA